MTNFGIPQRIWIKDANINIKHNKKSMKKGKKWMMEQINL
jgi:hypothetical protein